MYVHADVDSIFGRLYYYLDAKHRYEQPGGASVDLFTWQAGDDPNCVHFPYLEALRNKSPSRAGGVGSFEA
jgi:hypothetical protein